MRTPDRVQAAFRAVPREGFLPPAERSRATFDGPIPIGAGQTNSQPRTVADMLRLLDVHPGHRVLDVGCGSGWTTALLAELTGPEGRVRGVELEPSLVAFGRANLAPRDVPWADISQAEPGVLGLPGDAPYDRILVSADADELPSELVDQLDGDCPGGARLVGPVRGVMLLVVKRGEELEMSKHGLYRFVPLR